MDTQTLVTPAGMTGETQVHIIDHHPPDRALPDQWSYSGGECGATTTLLLERIIESGLGLTPVEATLLALGIYEDTGSLHLLGYHRPRFAQRNLAGRQRRQLGRRQ